MSTAIGHGLVDPKKRGKPVLANMVGLHLLSCPWSNFFGLCRPTTRNLDTARSVSKGKQVNIPVPSGWIDCLWGMLLGEN